MLQRILGYLIAVAAAALTLIYGLPWLSEVMGTLNSG